MAGRRREWAEGSGWWGEEGREREGEEEANKTLISQVYLFALLKALLKP